MSTTLTLLAIGVVSGFVFSIIRSRIQTNLLLSVEARREKHAPKVTEIPTQISSPKRRIQKAQENQIPTLAKSNPQAPEEVILESSSRQVDELSVEEREEYDLRDQARDENIRKLRLLVEDLFEQEVELNETAKTHTDKSAEQSLIELRNSWIEHNEQPLNEHASFVEQEEVGSGIMILHPEDQLNNDIDERLEREGGKTGDVQISLAWDDFNDLDLHLFCPSGERIYFNNKTSECGGELDVDMNVRPTSNHAVENIVWVENAPLGQYKVGVHFYKHHDRDETTHRCAFRIRLTVHDDVRDYSGSITYGQAMQMVTSFTLNDQKNALAQ